MRILLCDDDPAVLQQMERLLRKFFQQIGAKPPEIALYTDGEKLIQSRDTGRSLFLTWRCRASVESIPGND